jgi:hypothetical protein
MGYKMYAIGETTASALLFRPAHSPMGTPTARDSPTAAAILKKLTPICAGSSPPRSLANSTAVSYGPGIMPDRKVICITYQKTIIISAPYKALRAGIFLNRSIKSILLQPFSYFKAYAVVLRL